MPVKVSHLVLATILVPLELHHDLWQDIIEDFRVILQIKCDSMNNQPAARMIHPLGIRTRACPKRGIRGDTHQFNESLEQRNDLRCCAIRGAFLRTHHIPRRSQ